MHPGFPPVFEGDPLAYGMALFGDVLSVMLCSAIVLHSIFEVWRLREVEEIVCAPFRRPIIQRPTLLMAFRLLANGLLLMIIMRTLPDAVILLAWGELPQVWIERLAVFDFLFDFLALIPLGLSIFMLVWTRQSMPQQLMKVVSVPLTPLTWPNIKQVLQIATLVTVISVLVTVGKAGFV